MGASQQNNVEHLLVGGEGAIAVSIAKTLVDGEIGAFTPGGLRITNVAVAGVAAAKALNQDFYLALGGTSPLQRTPVIKGGSIKNIKAKAYSAATQQLDYIGSNGTSGSIEVFDNNLYMVGIYMQDYMTSSNDGRYIKHYQYKSDASAAQSEIALGLAASAYFNFSREAKNASAQAPITFKAVCDNAGVANGITAGGEWTHLTFIQGSKFVTGTIAGVAATALGTDEDIDTVVAGDFLRAGTATTADVYKIVAKTVGTTTAPLTIELDAPYRGTTTNIAAASTEYITAALGLAGNWGVAQTGSAKDYVKGKEFYGVNAWETVATDFGNSTVSGLKTTAATKGLGEVNAVKQLEWFTKGNQGEHYRVGQTVYDYTSEVDSAVAGYDFLSISVESSDLVGFQNNMSPMTITLATDETAALFMTTADTGLRDVLETIAGTGLIAAAGLDV